MSYLTLPHITRLLAITSAIVLGPFGYTEESTDRTFDYFQNSWNVIAVKDYPEGTRITPDNELVLSEGHKLKLYFGQDWEPLSRTQTKTCMDGWLPIILLTAQDDTVRYDFTLWATPLPTVADWRAAFNWPTEGENFLNWILVKATNTGSKEAVAQFKTDRIDRLTPKSPSFEWTLKAGESVETVLRIPFAPGSNLSDFDREDPNLWLDRTASFWRDYMAQGTQIQVPCWKSTQTLYAAHVCQAIANDLGALHGGEGFYDTFYIRDGGYQIMELEEAGLWDMVDKAMSYYLRSQRPDGRFETQHGQFDANGQALWVLWQYYKITGDLHWLKNEAYPKMLTSVNWMREARRQSQPESPYAGVLPNAIADGEFLWKGENHIVGYDFWNLRGLLCTADAATALGQTARADELLGEAKAYREAIDTVWKQTGFSHFPPSWEGVGTHWGNTETLWPTELFAVDDPRVTALLEEVHERHGGGFQEGTIRWLGDAGEPDTEAIHPYMSSYSTMAALIRGEHDRFVEEFYWYLLHSTAAHAFPEGIYYKKRFAWSDTIPHVTGASNYAILLRHMLMHEKGDELHLLLGVPDWWLADGEEIVIERAPSHFGPLDLTVRGTADGVSVDFRGGKRLSNAKRVVLHLPESRPLVGSLEGVEIITRPDQKKRWDFPTIVKLYEKSR